MPSNNHTLPDFGLSEHQVRQIVREEIYAAEQDRKTALSVGTIKATLDVDTTDWDKKVFEAAARSREFALLNQIAADVHEMLRRTDPQASLPTLSSPEGVEVRFNGRGIRRVQDSMHAADGVHDQDDAPGTSVEDVEASPSLDLPSNADEGVQGVDVARVERKGIDGDGGHVSPSVGADRESASPTVGDVPGPGSSVVSGTPSGVEGSEPTA